MSRTRNLAAGVLFGTTFLWLMPSFLGDGDDVRGAQWSVIQFVVVLTVTGFAAAALGLWKGKQWWRLVAIGSAIVGLAGTVLWWFAVRALAGVPNVGPNLIIHGTGSAVVLLVLLSPGFSSRLERRLQA